MQTLLRGRGQLIWVSLIAACIAVLAFLLPQLYGTHIDVSHAMLSFGNSPVTAIQNIKTSKSNGAISTSKLLYINNTYYLAFTSSSGMNADAVYLTTSSDGVSWSEPNTISPSISGSSDEYRGDLPFKYNSLGGYFGTIYRATSTNLTIFATSSDGVNWTTSSPWFAYTGHGQNVDLAFSPSSADKILLLRGTSLQPDQAGMSFKYSSNGGASWTTSTISSTPPLEDERPEPYVAGITNETGSDIFHVVYILKSNFTTATAQIYYASSSDGITWTTTSVSGEDMYDNTMNANLRGMGSFDISSNGTITGVYILNDVIDFGPPIEATSTMVLAQKSSGGTWSTSTFKSNATLTGIGQTASRMTDFTYLAPTVPAFAYPLGAVNGYISINTSTWIESQYFSGTQTQAYKVQTAWNGNDTLGIAYVATNTMYFVTTSLALAVPPNMPSFSGETVGTSTYTLNWNDNSSNETGFSLEYITGSDTNDFPGTVVTTSANATNTTITDLIPAAQYRARLGAFNANGTSTYVTRAAFYTLPVQASPLTVSSTGVDDISFIVDDSSGNSTQTTYAVLVQIPSLFPGFSYWQKDTGAANDTPEYNTAASWGTFSTSSPTFLGPNTLANHIVVARNGENVNAATSSVVSVYTLAAQASAPTLSSVASSSLTLAMAAVGATNSTATTFGIHETTTDQYVNASSTLQSSAVYQTTSTWSNVSVSSLTPNKQYTFSVIARNGDGINAASSTAVSTTTPPVLPGTPSATATGQTTMTVTWTSDNATGTVYELYNVTDSAVVGTTTEKTYSVTGLTAGTSYQFKVRAQYASDASSYTSYSSNSTAVSTNAATSSGGGSSTGTSPITSNSPAPSTPDSTDSDGDGNADNASAQETYAANEPTETTVGSQTHTVTVSPPNDNGEVDVTVQSDPVTVRLAEGEEAVIDTDADGTNDLYLKADEILTNGAELTFVSLPDLGFTIAGNLSEVSDQEVLLYINSDDATLMAISNSNDFAGVPFVAYEPTIEHTLTVGDGEKTVYVKLKNAQGGDVTLSDSITLAGQGFAEDPDNLTGCDLATGKAYGSEESSAVYLITEGCTKRPFSSAAIFFTYFTSWDDVLKTVQSSLDALTLDSLGFMPYGPLWDPQYGAIVKHPFDPKVYLLLNGEKYWITSEDVFEALYGEDGWSWIEDVDPALLENYADGEEIAYTDHHPNYTLVKYVGSPKVFRLEPHPEDATAQVKRWIVNEAVFHSLGFRLDRIVTIPNTEVYEDGEPIEE